MLTAPANLPLVAFPRAYLSSTSVPVQPTNRLYQQPGKSWPGGTKGVREPFIFPICGVAPTRAMPATNQKDKPTNRQPTRAEKEVPS